MEENVDNKKRQSVSDTHELKALDKEKAKMRAKESNRSLNNYVEELLSDAVSERPNPVTLAAIEEARSGKSAGVVDTSSLDAFIKSCSE